MAPPDKLCKNQDLHSENYGTSNYLINYGKNKGSKSTRVLPSNINDIGKTSQVTPLKDIRYRKSFCTDGWGMLLLKAFVKTFLLCK